MESQEEKSRSDDDTPSRESLRIELKARYKSKYERKLAPLQDRLRASTLEKAKLIAELGKVKGSFDALQHAHLVMKKRRSLAEKEEEEAPAFAGEKRAWEKTRKRTAVSAVKDGLRGVHRCFRLKLEEPAEFAKVMEKVETWKEEKCVTDPVKGCVHNRPGLSRREEVMIYLSAEARRRQWGQAVLATNAICANVLQIEPAPGAHCSHLCHSHGCMNASHMVVESASDNEKRNKCAAGGRCVCGQVPVCIL